MKNMYKLDLLKKWLKEKERVLIAFSGGVDSTLLLKVADDVLGDDVMAVTVSSSINNPEETRQAIMIAEFIGVKNHHIIEIDDLAIPEVKNNVKDRCYYCKKNRFEKLLQFADEANSPVVIEGTNHDDLTDYRPGRIALDELKIESPLLLLEFSKQDIREAAKLLELPNWNKNPEPCLATRFPVNTIITEKELNNVLLSESFLKSLLSDDESGNLRVRMHNNLARIEVSPLAFDKIVENKTTITKTLKKIGFSFVSLDLEGYTVGNMNQEDIKNGRKTT